MGSNPLIRNLIRLPEAAQRLVPKLRIFENPATTLFQTLARLPQHGVGSKIIQTRWAGKGFSDCYWLIKRVKLKDDRKHGKAYGQLYWRGQPIPIKHTKGVPEPTDKLIRGGLKHRWRVFTEVDTLEGRAAAVDRTPLASEATTASSPPRP